MIIYYIHLFICFINKQFFILQINKFELLIYPCSWIALLKPKSRSTLIFDFQYFKKYLGLYLIYFFIFIRPIYACSFIFVLPVFSTHITILFIISFFNINIYITILSLYQLQNNRQKTIFLFPYRKSCYIVLLIFFSFVCCWQNLEKQAIHIKNIFSYCLNNI